MLRSVLNQFLKALNLQVVEYSKWSKIAKISGKPLPVYVNQDFSPCFKLNRSPITDRIFILTIPKSGTYLIAKILESMGIVNCDVHIATENIQDNRFADEDILRIQPGRYLILAALDLSADLIYPGQFGFGHLPCSEKEEYVLKKFKKVFTFRDLRDVIISLVRYHDSREHRLFKPERLSKYEKFKKEPMGSKKIKFWFEVWGTEYESLIRHMSPWKDHKNIFQLKFEVLMGDNGEGEQISLLRDLSGFMGFDIDDVKIQTVLRESIGSDTITYSGKRSSYKEWWTDSIEELFISYGFDNINKNFGYQ